MCCLITLLIFASVAGLTGVALLGYTLGHFVLVFSNTGIFFLKVFLSVGVYALRNMLGLIREQPALMLIEGIMEGIFYPLALFKGIHTSSYTASCTAYGKIACVREYILVIIHYIVGFGLSSPFCMGERITENIRLLLGHFTVSYIECHIGEILLQEW